VDYCKAISSYATYKKERKGWQRKFQAAAYTTAHISPPSTGNS